MEEKSDSLGKKETVIEDLTKVKIINEDRDANTEKKKDSEIINNDVSPEKNGSFNDKEEPSNNEIVNSLRSSLKSTPHSVVNKTDPENDHKKGAGWKVWAPILGVIAMFLLVVIVVSVNYDYNRATLGKL